MTSNLKLYWVDTSNHDEDWFVVAKDARAARRFFELEEGFLKGEAKSKLILVLPSEWQNKWDDAEHWPSDDLLESCGSVDVPLSSCFTGQEAVKHTTIYAMLGYAPRAVRINDCVYIAGDMASNVVLSSPGTTN